MPVREKRERIHMDLPVGTNDLMWAWALEMGRRFATEFMDKPTGRRHGCAYTLNPQDIPQGFRRMSKCRVAEVWWTATRAISVRAWEE